MHFKNSLAQAAYNVLINEDHMKGSKVIALGKMGTVMKQVGKDGNTEGDEIYKVKFEDGSVEEISAREMEMQGDENRKASENEIEDVVKEGHRVFGKENQQRQTEKQTRRLKRLMNVKVKAKKQKRERQLNELSMGHQPQTSPRPSTIGADRAAKRATADYEMRRHGIGLLDRSKLLNVKKPNISTSTPEKPDTLSTGVADPRDPKPKFKYGKYGNRSPEQWKYDRLMALGDIKRTVELGKRWQNIQNQLNEAAPIIAGGLARLLPWLARAGSAAAPAGRMASRVGHGAARTVMGSSARAAAQGHVGRQARAWAGHARSRSGIPVADPRQYGRGILRGVGRQGESRARQMAHGARRAETRLGRAIHRIETTAPGRAVRAVGRMPGKVTRGAKAAYKHGYTSPVDPTKPRGPRQFDPMKAYVTTDIATRLMPSRKPPQPKEKPQPTPIPIGQQAPQYVASPQPREKSPYFTNPGAYGLAE